MSVFSNVSGIVTKLGYPYASYLEFRYVEITDLKNFRHRYFYVSPRVSVGDKINIGVIGLVPVATVIAAMAGEKASVRGVHRTD